MRLHSSQDGQKGGCDDDLWLWEGAATTCGDDGVRDDGGIVVHHGGGGAPRLWPSWMDFCPMQPPIEKRARQNDPIDVLVGLTSAFLEGTSTAGAVAAGMVPRVHADCEMRPAGEEKSGMTVTPRDWPSV